MKKLNRTVFITAPEVMSVDKNFLVVTLEDKEIARESFRNIEAICYYGYAPVRATLMDACARHGTRLYIHHPDGQLISSITSPTYDNSFIRRKQYQAAMNPAMCLEISKSIILAKVFNSRWFLGLMSRTYEKQLDIKLIMYTIESLKLCLGEVMVVRDMDALQEIRKTAKTELHAAFDHLIVKNKDLFSFNGRSTKQPTDRINALLTFAYGLLEELCTSALEAAGLDPHMGFFHTENPHRAALTFDLMEEFRACMADKFVFTVINQGLISSDAFEEVAEGDFAITNNGAEILSEQWLKLNRKTTDHTPLAEKIEWGMAPHVSALLLAQFLAGEIDTYPAFTRHKQPH